MPAGWLQRGACALLLVLSAWAFSYRLGAVPLLDDPNEAEYAEVAREMVETGDWISPRLNYVLFLNKPPLEYWAVGLSYLGFGVNEFAARLPSAIAGFMIVVFVWRLGMILFDAETGVLAGFVLLATGGFFVETHEVRPDLLLTAAIAGSLVAIARLRANPSQQRWPLIGLQVALAAGLLAKGMLAVLVPACVLSVLALTERRSDLIRLLLHPRAWWLFLLLVTPWHLVMTLKHPGFLWDYVINQHVLFFFDRKFPRDSVPVSLPVFWAAFALRLFPWTVFVPLAFLAAVTTTRKHAEQSGDRIVLTWAGAVLLFFSAAASRMEHYSIPALPAAVLLVAKLFRDSSRQDGPTWSRAVTVHVVLFAVATLAGPFTVPGLVAAQEWLAPIHELPVIAQKIFTLLAAGAVIAAGAALARRRSGVAAAIVATFVIAIPMFHQGLALMARVNSSRPMAAAVAAFAEPDEPIIYEAPIEYQTCAGFNFYLRRRLDLLRPPDFVAPTYLAPHVGTLFITPADLQKLWQEEHVYFITDPLQARPALDGVVPKPVYIIARDNVRWAVSSQPVH